MGSSLKPKSTRAKRSVKSIPKLRPTPKAPETAKRKERALRKGINRFLTADRLSRDAVHERPKPKRRAEAILKAAQATEPGRMGDVKPATTGESVSVSATALREIRKMLVTTRAVVASCALALDSFPDTDDIHLTLEEDVVEKLNHLDVVLRLIIGNQPFEALLGVES